MAVFEATKAALEALGALESVDGQVALVLAQQLDDPRAGMAVAQDAKTLTALMAQIRDAAPKPKADPIDELNARRQAGKSTPKAG